MTEEQALTKWCPFSRKIWSLSDDDGSCVAAAINRHGDGDVPAGTNCIGSRCMAWRVAARSPEFGRCGLVPVAP